MFAAGIKDLIRAPWRRILEELKLSGGLPIPEIQKRTGGSYMGAKDRCEALRKRGFLETWRIPRTEVGRPEIMYRLSPKADLLFPDSGRELAMQLLASADRLYGDTAAERLLFLYFQNSTERLKPLVAAEDSLLERAKKLSELRNKEGYLCRLRQISDTAYCFDEYHSPLAWLYISHPRTVNYEEKLLESLLGVSVERREIDGKNGATAHVEYHFSS